MRRLKYTKEILEDAAKNSYSYAGMSRYMNIRYAGGSQHHLKRLTEKYKIDCSHFCRPSSKGRLSTTKLTNLEILVVRTDGRRQHAYLLRRALLEIGILYQCEICGNNGKWLNEDLLLQVDHRNRDWLDDRKENLRFLCPNCHDQITRKQLKKQN